jgi:uncharacterized repeat protein (TIGR03803 family)
MRELARYVLSIGAAALIAGCGGSQPYGAPGVIPHTPALAVQTDSTNYTVVYSFSGTPDGSGPKATLINVGGTLFGTTDAGGAYPYCGCGTVFSVTREGTEKVLHSFTTRRDGRNPRAGLIDVRGTLYGTTVGGGSYECLYGNYYYSSCGTVFSITPTGTEKVLHRFSGYPNDGAFPVAPLIDVKGTLYGTTESGGGSGCYGSYYAVCGAVFSITRGGVERMLHSFRLAGGGREPQAGLVDVDGTLYGTTVFGGKHGYGTVFKITTGGKERTLYSFGAGKDGRNPYAGLTELGGTLYGTTLAGGSFTCSQRSYYYSCGTVFSITPGGKERVLHSFGNGADGANPYASLMERKGTLYGTTLYGGANTCGRYYGCGTVFSITPAGKETVLHSFGAASDGALPQAGLVDVDGTLYGTTIYGGAHDEGTVFSLKP